MTLNFYLPSAGMADMCHGTTFVQYWGLSLGLCEYYTSTLPMEIHLSALTTSFWHGVFGRAPYGLVQSVSVPSISVFLKWQKKINPAEVETVVNLAPTDLLSASVLTQDQSSSLENIPSLWWLWGELCHHRTELGPIAEPGVFSVANLCKGACCSLSSYSR